ncbi:hypothetical protein KW805_02765 [Candidatus Pacearchaeota archaeon]|nr:hypothetical protein [Candidatus Pacearchaeota archaeon]
MNNFIKYFFSVINLILILVFMLGGVFKEISRAISFQAGVRFFDTLVYFPLIPILGIVSLIIGGYLLIKNKEKFGGWFNIIIGIGSLLVTGWVFWYLSTHSF